MDKLGKYLRIERNARNLVVLWILWSNQLNGRSIIKCTSFRQRAHIFHIWCCFFSCVCASDEPNCMKLKFLFSIFMIESILFFSFAFVSGYFRFWTIIRSFNFTVFITYYTQSIWQSFDFFIASNYSFSLAVNGLSYLSSKKKRDDCRFESSMLSNFPTFIIAQVPFTYSAYGLDNFSWIVRSGVRMCVCACVSKYIYFMFCYSHNNQLINNNLYVHSIQYWIISSSITMAEAGWTNQTITMH